MDNQPQDGPMSADDITSGFASLLGVAPEEDEQDDAGGDDSVEETESEEDEGAEDETETDEEEADEQPQQTGKTFAVKVNGKTLQVPLDELINGYQRQSDYTRKNQAVAESRKAIEAEQETLRAERAQFAQLAQAAIQKVRREAPAEPNWAELKANDPIGYTIAWTEHQQYHQEIQNIERQYAVAMQRNQQTEQEQLQRTLAEESSKLSAAVPVFADPEKAAKETAALVQYGKGQGFSDEELAQVYDHRTVVVLRKAMLYDKLLAQRPQLQAESRKPGTPVAKAGATQNQQLTGSKNALQRLRKTGSIKDAAAAFERFV